MTFIADGSNQGYWYPHFINEEIDVPSCRLSSSRAPIVTWFHSMWKHPAHVCTWQALSPRPTPHTLLLVPSTLQHYLPFSPRPSGICLFPTPATVSVVSRSLSPKTGAKKTWEDGGGRSHWYWATGLLLGDRQLRVTLVPTRGTPRRWQDGGAGGTGGGETG